MTVQRHYPHQARKCAYLNAQMPTHMQKVASGQVQLVFYIRLQLVEVVVIMAIRVGFSQSVNK